MASAYPTAAGGVMRFHLVFNGLLPSSGNKPKPVDVMRIREEFDPQLRELWATHHALQILKDSGAKKKAGGAFVISPASPRLQTQQGSNNYEDCLLPLTVGNISYQPLVRQSLDLNCELSILFLRQQDPGELISQSGDLDGRIKALIDALRMPDKGEQDVAPPKAKAGLFCLMQNDTLVSRLDIDTDRLLFPKTTHQHEVHLVVEVKLNVLRVGEHNMCLL